MHPTGVVFLVSLILYAAYLVSTFAARRWSGALLLGGTAALAAAWLYFAASFLTLDSTLLEVAKNTNAGLAWWLRLAASWASAGSSLLLMSLLLGLYIFAAARAGAPVNALRISAAVLIMVGLLSFLYGTFDTLSEPTIGGGLNPLLKSFWMTTHPPLVFLGYAGVLVSSLALALADTQALRRLMYTALGFLFAGLVVGGYWSYVTFGWGGYWAWDPVETAQLMVFVATSAALHAPAALDRLKRGSFLLAASSVFLALFVTRTGMSPLHGFASPGAGGYLLLALALAFLFAFLRDVLMAKLGGGAAWGRLVTFLTMFVAALLLYGSLLLPSLGVAAGVNASPPQMDDGMWFYNPALYLLVVVTLALAPLIYLERGGKPLLLYLGVGLAASSAVAVAAYVGLLTFSPKSHVLTNAAVGAALVWSALGAAVIIYSAARANSRFQLALRALHLALLLFFVAAVYSLPFAYNKAYFTDLYITPGVSARVAGVEIAVENYSLGLMQDKVDIYTVYRNNAVYSYAQYGLFSMTNLLSQARPMLEEALRRVEKNPVLKTLFDAARNPVSVGDVYMRLQDGSVLAIRNATFGTYATHSGGGLFMVAYIYGRPDVSIGNQTSFQLAEPCVVRAGPLTLNISGPVVAQGSGAYAAFMPMRVVASAFEKSVALPMPLDMNLTLYYMAKTPGTPIYGLLDVPYLDYLTNIRFGHVFLQRFPAEVLSGAYADVSLRVAGARGHAVVRYEVNGEVSGIHGLVSSVVTVPRGLGDVYVAVFTPYIVGDLSYYPEPMIYYINYMLKTRPPEDALRIAALLTTGFYLDQLSRSSPDAFASLYTNAFLEVLRLAHSYDPANSPAYTEGIHITVKEVPAVNLLWAASAAAAAALFTLAAVRRR